MKINPTEIFAIAQKSCITVKRMHQKIITKTRERKTTVKRKTTTQLQTSTSTLNHWEKKTKTIESFVYFTFTGWKPKHGNIAGFAAKPAVNIYIYI